MGKIEIVMNSLQTKNYEFSYLKEVETSFSSRDYTIKKQMLSFTMTNEEIVTLPYRIPFDDKLKKNVVLSQVQQLIYHCIFTRSTNGYKREYHTKEILKTELNEWCMPFIVQLSGEYIVEILYEIYNSLIQKDNTELIKFCRLNIKPFLYCHARMISYWDCYYKDKYFYKDYVGQKIFLECLGYTRSLEHYYNKNK